MIFIALLRGINVSGQKIIKMTDLKTLCEGLAFTDVQTYIQSGNIVFRSSLNSSEKIGKQLELAIEKHYGFEVPICIFTLADFTSILEKNKLYTKEKENQLYLTYLNGEADFTLQQDIETKKVEGDEILFSSKAVYLYVSQGYGKTKLTNVLIENKLKVKATTRNWKTSGKLLEMAQELDKKQLISSK
ncbi:MAG: DUF1697 domain-containing protein [Flavobacteriaceae bacterium]|jgi:uncharacterized protein (DUF1697 family)|nr:DUF1697 domain-containing protein [Flavobacteriaceae bacterium]